MLIGYARVSKSDGSQVIDLQRDALEKEGVSSDSIYVDTLSGKKDDRPGLNACLKALRKGDVLLVWKLDRIGKDLKHLVNTIHGLAERHIGFKVLTGQGAEINTTTASGKLVFGIFAALAEFERELISERTRAGLASARARGRFGGRKGKMGQVSYCIYSNHSHSLYPKITQNSSVLYLIPLSFCLVWILLVTHKKVR